LPAPAQMSPQCGRTSGTTVSVQAARLRMQQLLQISTEAAILRPSRIQFQCWPWCRGIGLVSGFVLPKRLTSDILARSGQTRAVDLSAVVEMLLVLSSSLCAHETDTPCARQTQALTETQRTHLNLRTRLDSGTQIRVESGPLHAAVTPVPCHMSTVLAATSTSA
jgi:hypothetical protein